MQNELKGKLDFKTFSLPGIFDKKASKDYRKFDKN